MKPESSVQFPKPGPNLAIWLSGAFGLAIVVGAAFVTGYLALPLGGSTSKAKLKPEVRSATGGPTTAPIQPASIASTSNSVAGEVALAKLWTEIDAPKLSAITDGWRPIELAPILMRMKNDKVSELLAEMKPDRASAISREIQRISSR